MSVNFKITKQTLKTLYIPVAVKFVLGNLFAILWISFSIFLSIPWLRDLASIFTLPVAIIILTGIAYIPGYLNSILIVSLLMDKQPHFKNLYPTKEVTVIIAARNEEKKIGDALKYISNQDYQGKIKVIVIDNGSSDLTSKKALEAWLIHNLDVSVITEVNPGKYNALNTGLKHIYTDLVITLDADTLLHKSSIRYIVARMESSPSDVCAVAGTVLTKNSRDNLITKIQEWDYFLSIASIKRFQGLYQGTLVAQGAYSIYRASAVKEVGGWPNAIGEDIVLTWNFLKSGRKVYFEPLAVAFTEVPITLKHLARQRSRWARGMFEAISKIKPWQQPGVYNKFLTGVDIIIPFLDLIYTFCWLPGLFLAIFGIFWIVGPMTLLVLPLTFLSYYIIYLYQKYIFRSLNLKIRKNKIGFLLFVLCYQIIMSPVSLWGYIEEVFKLDRIWK